MIEEKGFWESTSGSASGFDFKTDISERSGFKTASSFLMAGETGYSHRHMRESGITSSALKFLNSVDNASIRNSAEKFLFLLHSLLSNVFSLDELPPLRAFQSEDNALIFEWVFPHFRVGFSIEQEIKESGWFLASDESSGSIMASGSLLGSEMESIVIWLLQFIALHY